jgi:hypothetical protein
MISDRTTAALVAMMVGCVGWPDTTVSSSGNPALGIAAFETEDTDAKTSVIGRDVGGHGSRGSI